MAKKQGKTKVPKAIAGVKVPKELRKAARALIELAQDPLAREIASAALVAAASVLATRRDKPDQPAAPRRHGMDVGGLLAQGAAALLAGLSQPPRKPDASPSPADRPTPKRVA